MSAGFPFLLDCSEAGRWKVFPPDWSGACGEGGSSLFPGKMMTASDDRSARGFIQLFRPGLLALLEALEVSFCHSSHRLPLFSVTFFFQFNRLAVLMLPFCQHLSVLSLFISAIFCFLRSSPRKYRKYALLCCSCLSPTFLSCFFLMRLPFFLFRFLLFSSVIFFKPVWPASSFFASFSDSRAQRASTFRHLCSLPIGAADRCPETFMWPFCVCGAGQRSRSEDCPSERQWNANCFDNSFLSCYLSVSVSVGWAVLSGNFPLVSPLSSCFFSAG